MVIKWAKLAKQDLISFYENTSKTKRNTKNYISSLVSYIENLIESPLLGKFLFHVENLEIRQLIFKQHRIIYYIEKDKIYIISIIHTARNIEKYIQYLKENKFK